MFHGMQPNFQLEIIHINSYFYNSVCMYPISVGTAGLNRINLFKVNPGPPWDAYRINKNKQKYNAVH